MNKIGIQYFLEEIGQDEIFFKDDSSGSSFGEKWQRVNFLLDSENNRLDLTFQDNLFGSQIDEFIEFLKTVGDDTKLLKLFKNSTIEIDGCKIKLYNERF